MLASAECICPPQCAACQWWPLVINAKRLYNSCFWGHIHTTLGHTEKVPPTPHTTYEHKEILCKTLLLATLCCLPLVCCSLGKDHSIPWQPGREQSREQSRRPCLLGSLSPGALQDYCWGRCREEHRAPCQRPTSVRCHSFPTLSPAQGIFIKSRKMKTLS